jgi:hypothetical protein
MPQANNENNLRRGNRTKAVLPVRIKGTDSNGSAFDELVHTLDVTPSGVRIGSLRRMLCVADEITVFYRQRRFQYRVIWVKQLKGTTEYQVGLQALSHDAEPWGIAADPKAQDSGRAVSASGVA